MEKVIITAIELFESKRHGHYRTPPLPNSPWEHVEIVLNCITVLRQGKCFKQTTKCMAKVIIQLNKQASATRVGLGCGCPEVE